MSGLYKLLVVLHIVSVVVGIGTVSLNGIYGSIAGKKKGPEGLAVSQANFDVSMIGEKFIYAIPVFGILAILASDDAWKFDQIWVWLSMLLYIAALGIAHAVLIPSHRKINELAAGPPSPEVGAQMQALMKKMAPAGMTANLLAVAIIALMVWKPL